MHVNDDFVLDIFYYFILDLVHNLSLDQGLKLIISDTFEVILRRIPHLRHGISHFILHGSLSKFICWTHGWFSQ